jgi:STE24 endopeptidase
MVLAVGFLLLHWLFVHRLAGLRRRVGIADLADPAGLPLVFVIMAAFFYLATPVNNHITWVSEAEADMYGINASREPYGWATSAMRLAAYRKLDPGPVEELLFYDHPSGRNRVRRAMLWLKENPAAVATMPAVAPQAVAEPPK